MGRMEGAGGGDSSGARLDFAAWQLRRVIGKLSLNIQIRNGTAVGNEALCNSCAHGHVQRGFRDSEELTHCTYQGSPRAVPFRVRECTDYQDRRVPELYELQQIARDLATAPVASLRPAGFALPNGDESEED